jgi:uncharacterized membrane protein (DUF2068 family)
MNDTAKGAGWLAFAGIMVLMAGILNVIWGIAALDDARFFIEDQRFILEDLNTMGWVVLVIGVIQVIAAFSIWAGGEFGRWIGIIAASLGAIGALLSIPGFPLWSVCVFGINLLVLYGLSAYGGHQSRAR